MASYGVDVGLVVGGPMVWACRASQYLRPVEDPPSDEEALPFWREVRGDPSYDSSAYLHRLGITSVAHPTRAALDDIIARHAREVPYVAAAANTFGAPPEPGRGLREPNLSLGALLLHLGFDARFALCRHRRRRRPFDDDDAAIVEDGASSSVRRPQGASWGPPTAYLRVFFAPAESVFVDASPLSDGPAFAVPTDGTERGDWRVRRQGRLYLLERSSASAWTETTLLDGRTSRPKAHFASRAKDTEDEDVVCARVEGSVRVALLSDPFRLRVGDDETPIADDVRAVLRSRFHLDHLPDLVAEGR